MKTNERYEPIKESEDVLNKFETLLNDFKIYRDGKAITLTRDELLNFHRLDGIIGGMIALDNYKRAADLEDYPIIDELFNDKEVCFLLDADIQDRLMAVSDDIETAVCERYVDEYRKKHGLPVKRNMEYLDM